jgi:nucleotide-binding universal stress UspA family protein
MFAKIIVGVDAREGGRDALALAGALARLSGGELIALHAYPWDYYVSRGASSDFEGAMHGAAMETLEEELERAGVGRVLAGDVTAGTLHSSPCPVVVAPAGYAQQGGRLETIGVGYDGSPESRAALDLARDLAETADARLRIIDVVVAPGADALVDGYRPDWTEEARIRREEAEARVQRFVADLGPMATGEAADALAFAGNSLDLLVTGSRNYGPIRRLMLGSTSSKLVHRAPCPVLVTTRSVEDAPAGAATASTGAQAS